LQIGFLARSHGGGINGLEFFFASALLLLPLTNTSANNSKDSAITNDIDVIVVIIVVVFILFLVNSFFSPSQKCYLRQKCCNNYYHQIQWSKMCYYALKKLLIQPFIVRFLRILKGEKIAMAILRIPDENRSLQEHDEIRHFRIPDENRSLQEHAKITFSFYLIRS
jgi:hypothetical protein